MGRLWRLLQTPNIHGHAVPPWIAELNKTNYVWLRPVAKQINQLTKRHTATLACWETDSSTKSVPLLVIFSFLRFIVKSKWKIAGRVQAKQHGRQLEQEALVRKTSQYSYWAWQHSSSVPSLPSSNLSIHHIYELLRRYWAEHDGIVTVWSLRVEVSLSTSTPHLSRSLKSACVILLCMGY